MAGYTPLDLAAKFGRTDIVQILLGNWPGVPISDLDINRLRSPTVTPMHLAATNGHVEVIKLLLAQGFNPNFRTQDGNTALHEAAKFGRAEIIKILMQSGAQSDIKNKSGETALDVVLKMFRDSRKGEELRTALSAAPRAEQQPRPADQDDSPSSPPGPAKKVRARADYTPTRTDGGALAFRKGDIITVYRRSQNGWWHGELNGAIGVFPQTYVEDIPPSSADTGDRPSAPRPASTARAATAAEEPSPPPRSVPSPRASGMRASSSTMSARSSTMEASPAPRASPRAVPQSVHASEDDAQEDDFEKAGPAVSDRDAGAGAGVGTDAEANRDNDADANVGVDADADANANANADADVGTTASGAPHGDSAVAQITLWLARTRLESYVNALMDNGWDDIRYMHLITEADLDAMGMSAPGSRKKFLLAVSKLPKTHHELRGGPPATVMDLLDTLNLAQYEQNFSENNYDTVESVIEIAEEELEPIGVTLRGHQARLLYAGRVLSGAEEIDEDGTVSGVAAAADDDAEEGFSLEELRNRLPDDLPDDIRNEVEAALATAVQAQAMSKSLEEQLEAKKKALARIREARDQYRLELQQLELGPLPLGTQRPARSENRRSVHGSTSVSVPSVVTGRPDAAKMKSDYVRREMKLTAFAKFRVKYLGVSEVPREFNKLLALEAMRKTKLSGYIDSDSIAEGAFVIFEDRIKVVAANNEIIHEIPIERISYCTRDPAYSRLFGLVCAEPGISNFLCHVYDTRDSKQAVNTLARVCQAVFSKVVMEADRRSGATPEETKSKLRMAEEQLRLSQRHLSAGGTTRPRSMVQEIVPDFAARQHLLPSAHGKPPPGARSAAPPPSGSRVQVLPRQPPSVQPRHSTTSVDDYFANVNAEIDNI